MIVLSGARSKSENHLLAIRKLRVACGSAKIDAKGIPHLQRLLEVKTDISYGDKPAGHERITALCIAAERFQAWAEPILKSWRGEP